MKLKTKKIMAMMMLVLMLITSLPIQAFAGFITDINSDAKFGTISGSLSKCNHELHYATYDGKTYIVFCVQRGVTSPSGKEYEYNGDFIAQFKSDRPKYEKIAEMIFWGYTSKHGTGLPSTTQEYKDACATQQFVWEYIHNNIDSSLEAPSRSSWNSTYMSSSIYSSWLKETEKLYDDYHNNISFDGNKEAMDIGSETTVKDSNGVLKNFATFSKTIDGVTFSHEEGSNNLKISATENAKSSATFNSASYGIYELLPNGKKYSEDTMSNYVYFKFNSGSIQNLMFSNYVDPVSFKISVEVQSGKVQIKKTNNIGNPVANCKFELYKDEACTQKVSSGTSNSNGQITFDKLKVGTYFVKETEVPQGYLIDKTVKKAVVKNGETTTVEFKNDEPLGKILIYKVNENGDKVDNAEFEVTATENITNVAKTKTFYTKGQTVAKIKTVDGVASKDNLPMGSYQVKEINAPYGYLVNEKVYSAKLEYKNNTTPVVEIQIKGVVNQEPRGKITIIKKDSETGSIPQGDATFVDAKYEVRANEDIYNVAKTKKFYSKGDLVATRTMDEKGTTEDVKDLPLGKYVVKETVSSKGYLLDTKEYNIELKYKDQNEKVISESMTSYEQVKKMGVHVFKSGIKTNSGETPGLEGAEFTIKLYKDVQNAYAKGYTYAEVWNGINERGDKVKVDENRVKEAQTLAPSYAKIITDKDGNAYTQKNLPFGKYIVKETNTPKDYETAEDFTFSITQDESEVKEVAQKSKHLIVNNEQLETYIKLIKKDAKTGKTVTLNSATFEIRATKDIYDRATGKILYKKGEAVSQKVGSETFTSFTTNSQNLVVPDKSYNNKKEDLGTVVTPLKLEVGSYEIQEIKTPQGFLKLEKPVTFNVEGLRDYDKDQDGDYIKIVTIKNEQPTGTLIIDKTVALRENVNTSLVDISDLSGIEFTLTAKEDVISPIDGSVIYKAGQEVNKYNLDKNGDLKVTDLPMGTYEVQETKTIDGLVLNDKKYEIKFEQKDEVTKVYEVKKDISNDTTLLEISKTTITGDKELVGAKLTVLDEKGNTIDSWVSTEKTHTIEGIKTGKYILREEIAVEPYVKATDIEFTVEETAEIQKVTMIDKLVEISKEDISGKEIEGAKLQVKDKHGNIIDEWTSGKESHKVKGLAENETYTLHEEVCVGEYVKASDLEFTVSQDKETQKITMIDKLVEVTKTDLTTGEELEGAKLQVIDEEENIVDEWTSSKEPHKVIGLEENKTYRLVETTAPYGYEIAEEVTFTVTTDKETQKVEMKDMPILKDIQLIKNDSKTKEVIKEKFTFGLYEDEECTKLIQQMDSDKKTGTVKFEDLRYGTYFIKEVSAPKGYNISDEIVKLEINDKGVFINGELVEEQDELYSFEFENAPIETPNTGDNSNIVLWTSLLAMSLATITGIVVYDRKKKKSNK